MPTSNTDEESGGHQRGTEASVEIGETFYSVTPKSANSSASIIKDEGVELKVE